MINDFRNRPPRHPGHHPMPPHIRHSIATIEYDYEKLCDFYGQQLAAFVQKIMEIAPVEQKLILSILLDSQLTLNADFLENYIFRNDDFPNPFLTEEMLDWLANHTGLKTRTLELLLSDIPPEMNIMIFTIIKLKEGKLLGAEKVNSPNKNS